MTMQLTLPRLAAVATIALTIGCTMAQDSVQAQEGNAMLPKFFEGMTLLEENDCPSFTVRYYATPVVTMAELKNLQTDKGFGGVVVPKNGVRLTEVLYSSSVPIVDNYNYFILYQPFGKEASNITGNGLDGHAASPESAMEASPLFKEDGVFTFGSKYHDVLGQATNGMYGPGTITIDDRAPSIFRGSDGSSCTIRPPKIRFQIK